MRYFMTGATGFIARAVSRQLVAAGHEVVTVDKKPNRARDLMENGVEVMLGDINDKPSMRDAMRECDGVFHLAAYTRINAKSKPKTERLNVEVKRNLKETLKELREARKQESTQGKTIAERINVEGTRNVLELMKELKIAKGVFTSTMSVYSNTKRRMLQENYRYRGPWLSEYERTRWVAHFEVAEPMMREQRLPLVIVQPGTVYGPGDNSYVHTLIEMFLTKRLKSVPQKSARCWAHVEDVAAAHIAAMKKGKIGENYFLTGPAHTITYLVDQASKMTGIPAPKRQLSPGLLRFVSLLLTPVGAMMALPEDYSPEALRTMAGTTYLGANEKAKRDLDFSPRSLEEGLRETLAYEMKLLGMGPKIEYADDITVLELEPEQH
ncbi:MAG TPA: NAD-dependent epimerase/dehydratase family protein [Chthonomonadaceae bacterium]|nr:NAD-dependent epimerase/dehydratase family protein [Chthonomonadaceae bacterium]